MNSGILLLSEYSIYLEGVYSIYEWLSLLSDDHDHWESEGLLVYLVEVLNLRREDGSKVVDFVFMAWALRTLHLSYHSRECGKVLAFDVREGYEGLPGLDIDEPSFLEHLHCTVSVADVEVGSILGVRNDSCLFTTFWHEFTIVVVVLGTPDGKACPSSALEHSEGFTELV